MKISERVCFDKKADQVLVPHKMVQVCRDPRNVFLCERAFSALVKIFDFFRASVLVLSFLFLGGFF